MLYFYLIVTVISVAATVDCFLVAGHFQRQVDSFVLQFSLHKRNYLQSLLPFSIVTGLNTASNSEKLSYATAISDKIRMAIRTFVPMTLSKSSCLSVKKVITLEKG